MVVLNSVTTDHPVTLNGAAVAVEEIPSTLLSGNRVS